jgi:hypothetical protein
MKRVQHCPQSVEELDELASEPDRAVVETLSKIDGDLIVAGAGGKMGFHLALMLRRALNELGTGQKVIAISRFGEPGAREPFEAAGIETVPADLCDASVYDGSARSGGGLLSRGEKVRHQWIAGGAAALQ